MRVIAGTAKRLPLKTIPVLATRPTTDRIKETLFNIWQGELPGCRFLDLFAGSGAIGIEALSRGAAFAGFVEKNPKAAACIRENLNFTRLADRSTIWKTDVFSALQLLEGEEPFDCVFMDPPYGKELEKRALEMLAVSSIITDQSTIVVEADLSTDFSYAAAYGFEILKEKKYKTNAHIFLRRKDGSCYGDSSVSREF